MQYVLFNVKVGFASMQFVLFNANGCFACMQYHFQNQMKPLIAINSLPATPEKL